MKTIESTQDIEEPQESNRSAVIVDRCDVCSPENMSAIKINDVHICHDCLNFITYLAKTNNRTNWQELEYQSNYINNKKV